MQTIRKRVHIARIYYKEIIHFVQRKIKKKTITSYPLIRKHMCAYQGVRNVNFSENFVNVLNE